MERTFLFIALVLHGVSSLSVGLPPGYVIWYGEVFWHSDQSPGPGLGGQPSWRPDPTPAPGLIGQPSWHPDPTPAPGLIGLRPPLSNEEIRVMVRECRRRNFDESLPECAEMPNWDTSSVTSMHALFGWDQEFGYATVFNIDISRWNTASVTDMAKMFDGAAAFNGDLSAWNVVKVTNMASTFRKASTFNADLSWWVTSNVRSFDMMFDGAAGFNGDISSWNTGSATKMSSMFAASGFNGDLSPWNTSHVIAMDNLFAQARVFNGDLSKWDTRRAQDMSGVFAWATQFNGDVSRWDTSRATSMKWMFMGASQFDGDVSTWHVGSVTDMSEMFRAAWSFNRDLSRWNTNKVTSLRLMFAACDTEDNCDTPMFNGNVATWNTARVVNMRGLFAGAASFNGDVSRWDVSSVVDMTRTFEGASTFNGEVSGWSTRRVSSMRQIFDGASQFNGDLCRWARSRVEDASHAFRNSPKLSFCDVDECLGGADNCDESARCSNTDGSFVCRCNAGYVDWSPGAIGAEGSCDPNQCEGGHACHADAACTDEIRGHSCACNSGFRGDGQSCEPRCTQDGGRWDPRVEECVSGPPCRELGLAASPGAGWREVAGGLPGECECAIPGQEGSAIADCRCPPAAAWDASGQCVCENAFQLFYDQDGCYFAPPGGEVSDAPLQCPPGARVYEFEILEAATYHSVVNADFNASQILSYGTFHGVQARYRAGHIDCDLHHNNLNEYAWQTCRSFSDLYTGAAFELFVNREPVFEQVPVIAGSNRVDIGGRFPAQGCTALDPEPFSNGPITCQGNFTLARGDTVTLGWAEGYMPEENPWEDWFLVQFGALTIDLVGLHCGPAPPSCRELGLAAWPGAGWREVAGGLPGECECAIPGQEGSAIADCRCPPAAYWDARRAACICAEPQPQWEAAAFVMYGPVDEQVHPQLEGASFSRVPPEHEWAILAFIPNLYQDQVSYDHVSIPLDPLPFPFCLDGHSVEDRMWFNSNSYISFLESFLPFNPRPTFPTNYTLFLGGDDTNIYALYRLDTEEDGQLATVLRFEGTLNKDGGSPTAGSLYGFIPSYIIYEVTFFENNTIRVASGIDVRRYGMQTTDGVNWPDQFFTGIVGENGEWIVQGDQAACYPPPHQPGRAMRYFPTRGCRGEGADGGTGEEKDGCGTVCVAEPECTEEMRSRCSGVATCHVDGGSMCTCPRGYFGNGVGPGGCQPDTCRAMGLMASPPAGWRQVNEAGDCACAIPGQEGNATDACRCPPTAYWDGTEGSCVCYNQNQHYSDDDNGCYFTPPEDPGDPDFCRCALGETCIGNEAGGWMCVAEPECTEEMEESECFPDGRCTVVDARSIHCTCPWGYFGNGVGPGGCQPDTCRAMGLMASPPAGWRQVNEAGDCTCAIPGQEGNATDACRCPPTAYWDGTEGRCVCYNQNQHFDVGLGGCFFTPPEDDDCECPEGQICVDDRLAGWRCEEWPECTEETRNLECAPGAECTVVDARTVQCTCPRGYFGDGFGVDGCRPDTCREKGLTASPPTGWRQVNDEGYCTCAIPGQEGNSRADCKCPPTSYWDDTQGKCVCYDQYQHYNGCLQGCFFTPSDEDCDCPNGQTCIDDGACGMCVPEPECTEEMERECSVLAECTVVDARTVQCTCPRGYFGDGFGVDGCRPDTCREKGLTASPPTGWRQVNDEGYCTCAIPGQEGNSRADCKCPPTSYWDDTQGMCICYDQFQRYDQDRQGCFFTPPEDDDCDCAEDEVCVDDLEGGQACVAPPECSEDVRAQCAPVATCTLDARGFACKCPEGQVGDGVGAGGCRPETNPGTTRASSTPAPRPGDPPERTTAVPEHTTAWATTPEPADRPRTPTTDATPAPTSTSGTTPQPVHPPEPTSAATTPEATTTAPPDDPLEPTTTAPSTQSTTADMEHPPSTPVPENPPPTPGPLDPPGPDGAPPEVLAPTDPDCAPALEAARGCNLWVRNDLTLGTGDIQGKVCAGGSFTAANDGLSLSTSIAGVAENECPSGGLFQYTMVVGGDVQWNSGRKYRGAHCVGGVVVDRPTPPAGPMDWPGCAGDRDTECDDVIDFDGDYQQLLAVSDALWSGPAGFRRSVAEIVRGEILVSLDARGALHLVELDAELLAGWEAWGLRVEVLEGGVEAVELVVVNLVNVGVEGVTISKVLSVEAALRRRMLFNYPGQFPVEIRTPIYASMLIPRAPLAGSSSAFVDGQVVAKSYRTTNPASMTFNNHLLAGPRVCMSGDADVVFLLSTEAEQLALSKTLRGSEAGSAAGTRAWGLSEWANVVLSALVALLLSALVHLVRNRPPAGSLSPANPSKELFKDLHGQQPRPAMEPSGLDGVNVRADVGFERRAPSSGFRRTVSGALQQARKASAARLQALATPRSAWRRSMGGEDSFKLAADRSGVAEEHPAHAPSPA